MYVSAIVQVGFFMKVDFLELPNTLQLEEASHLNLPHHNITSDYFLGSGRCISRIVSFATPLNFYVWFTRTLFAIGSLWVAVAVAEITITIDSWGGIWHINASIPGAIVSKSLFLRPMLWSHYSCSFSASLDVFHSIWTSRKRN